mgnify:CR=1 FL=1
MRPLSPAGLVLPATALSAWGAAAEERVERWSDSIVSSIDRSETLPDLLALHMQELGGKHKENFALLTRADDIVPRAFQHLARRLRKVYKDAGKDIWISLPIVREWTPEGTFLDPSSPCGFSPLPQPRDFPHDGNAQDCGSGCALSWASANTPTYHERPYT